jgi:hypothetical protein
MDRFSGTLFFYEKSVPTDLARTAWRHFLLRGFSNSLARRSVHQGRDRSCPTRPGEESGRHSICKWPRAFLTASDEDLGRRTLQEAIDALVDTKHNSPKDRWPRSTKHPAFDRIHERLIIETPAKDFLSVLKMANVAVPDLSSP